MPYDASRGAFVFRRKQMNVQDRFVKDRARIEMSFSSCDRSKLPAAFDAAIERIRNHYRFDEVKDDEIAWAWNSKGERVMPWDASATQWSFVSALIADQDELIADSVWFLTATIAIFSGFERCADVEILLKDPIKMISFVQRAKLLVDPCSEEDREKIQMWFNRASDTPISREDRLRRRSDFRF